MAKLVPLKIIRTAKSGDSDALTHILRHYARYIASRARRPFYDEYGNRYDIIDEEIRQQLESHLMLQIVYKYDPEKLPKGETLQSG